MSGLGDLDQYNGRFTVTPDFPKGTYAYFVTIDATGTPAFPFVLAGQYYGAAGNGFSSTGSSSAATYFTKGTYSSGPAMPELTSWTTEHSTSYAQVVSGFDPAAGPATTWPGTNSLGVRTSGSVTTPALAEPQVIQYSSSTVFVTSNNLAGYTMGPWFSADMTGGVFANFPSSSNQTFQMPLSPTPASSLTNTGMGPQGMWVNGVALFNFLDGASYINATGVDSMAGNTPAYARGHRFGGVVRTRPAGAGIAGLRVSAVFLRACRLYRKRLHSQLAHHPGRHDHLRERLERSVPSG